MTSPVGAITYSDHAITMLNERGIAREWIEMTLAAPESVEPDPKHPERLRAFRAIAERDGRVLRVVYVQSGSAYRVITVFLDRSRKR